MVVATETSVFFIDGGFTKKSTLFWEVMISCCGFACK